jgi:hypothetical protein
LALVIAVSRVLGVPAHRFVVPRLGDVALVWRESLGVLDMLHRVLRGWWTRRGLLKGSQDRGYRGSAQRPGSPVVGLAMRQALEEGEGAPDQEVIHGSP